MRLRGSCSTPQRSGTLRSQHATGTSQPCNHSTKRQSSPYYFRSPRTNGLYYAVQMFGPNNGLSWTQSSYVICSSTDLQSTLHLRASTPARQRPDVSRLTHFHFRLEFRAASLSSCQQILSLVSPSLLHAFFPICLMRSTRNLMTATGEHQQNRNGARQRSTDGWFSSQAERNQEHMGCLAAADPLSAGQAVCPEQYSSNHGVQSCSQTGVKSEGVAKWPFLRPDF